MSVKRNIFVRDWTTITSLVFFIFFTVVYNKVIFANDGLNLERVPEQLELPLNPCQLALNQKMTLLEKLLITEKMPQQPFVRVHHRPNAETGGELSVAVFPKGTYHPDYEAQLQDEGYFAIIILNADEKDAKKYSDFMFGPEKVFWIQPTYLQNEFDANSFTSKQADVKNWFLQEDKELRSWIMNAAPKSKDRSSLLKRLEVMGQNYKVELKPLTLGDYEMWNREVFVPEVSRKKGGIFVWPATGKEFLERNHLKVFDDSIEYDKQQVRGWYRVFFYDQNGRLVAGSLMVHLLLDNPEGKKESRVVVGAAVYNPEARRDGAAAATLAQGMKLARQLGKNLIDMGIAEVANFSYGTDPNFYGPDIETSLQEFKLGMGFKPTPRRNPGDGGISKQLVKLLNTSLSQIDDRTADEVASGQSRPPAFVFYEFDGDGNLRQKVIKAQK